MDPSENIGPNYDFKKKYADVQMCVGWWTAYLYVGVIGVESQSMETNEPCIDGTTFSFPPMRSRDLV